MKRILSLILILLPCLAYTQSICTDTIAGPTVVCSASTIELTHPLPGGSWTSSNPSVATVGLSTGIVTGVSAGTSTITYDEGSCYQTLIVSVDPTPSAITGVVFRVCEGSTITLYNSVPGGTWSSDDEDVGTINELTGVLYGEPQSGGASELPFEIIYSVCSNTVSATVTLTALVELEYAYGYCLGETPTIIADSTGGKWYVLPGGEAVASIDSNTGEVTTLSAGNIRFGYGRPSSPGCAVDSTYTDNIRIVSAADYIEGDAVICVGESTVLGEGPDYGTWSSSNDAVATIAGIGDKRNTGTLTGVSAGTATITLHVSDSCFSTITVTVNPTPDAITGTMAVCVGSTTTLSNATGGGSWVTENPAIASVGSGTGIVSGIAAGTVTISYVLPTGCYASAIVTVNPVPEEISGSEPVCVGGTISLSSVTEGGTWGSGSPSVATVHASTGLVTGVSSGTAVITYTLATGCYVTAEVTINPLPASIGGTLSLYCAATTTLTNATGGGTWSSSNTSVATIDASGMVSGLSPGTTTISYTLETGCYTTSVVTVNAPIISGPSVVAVGATITLSVTPAGSGTWSSSNTAVGTINSSGVVAGLSGGTTIITYERSGGCFATKEITVCAPYSISVCETAPLATCDSTLAFCTGLTLEVTGASGSDISYEWAKYPSHGIIPTHSGGGVFTYTTTPIAGTYTYVVTADADGCESSPATFVLVVNSGSCFPCDYLKPCVEGDVCSTLPYFKTITASELNAGNITTGTNYYYVAKDAELAISPDEGSVFFMGYNVELTVEDSITLSGLHFFSGPGTYCLWKGISVTNDDPVAGQLTITNNTLIERASVSGVGLVVGEHDDGILPTAGLLINSDSAIYNQNVVGVNVHNFRLDTTEHEYPFRIVNSVFSNREFCGYSVASPSTCTDYYPYKWPTADELKSPTTTETGLNPSFGIDAYPGYTFTTTGIRVALSGNTNDADADDPIFYGIKIGDSGVVGNTNLIDSMYTGVLVANSNVNFYNNIIRRTRTNGQGIWGYMDPVYSGEKRAVTLMHGVESGTNNRFYNCYNGFYSSGYYTFRSDESWLSATLLDNTIMSTAVKNYGFRFLNSSFGKHIITNNNFYNLYGAIEDGVGSCTSPNGEIVVTGNTITGLDSFVSTNIGDYGIRIMDNSTCSTAHGSVEIANNNIKGLIWGIQVNAINNNKSALQTSIHDNTVRILKNARASARTRFGIECQSLLFADEITDNHIYGDVANDVNFNTFYPAPNSQGLTAYTGIYLYRVNGTSAVDVSCNYIHDLNIGFKFTDTCNINWRNNVMQRDKYGLVLHATYNPSLSQYHAGVMGIQGSACNPMDNIWYEDGDYLSSGWTNWLSYPAYQTFVVGDSLSALKLSKMYARSDSTSDYMNLPSRNGASNLLVVGTAYATANGTIVIAEDSCGETMADFVHCTDIPEESEARGIASGGNEGDNSVAGAYVISPNPGNGWVQISQVVPTKETVQVSVISYTGATVYSGSVDFASGPGTIVLQNPVPGIYLLVVTDQGGNSTTARLVVR